MLKEKCKNGPTKINLIREISNMITSILLRCMVGRDISVEQVGYWGEDGILRKVDLSYSLKNCFSAAIDRMASPHVGMFPQLASWYILPRERRILANCKLVREFLKKVWLDRKNAY